MLKRPWRRTSSNPAHRTIDSHVRLEGRHHVIHLVSPWNSAAPKGSSSRRRPVLLREDQIPATEASQALEREHRVAHVDQHRATEDEVELAAQKLRGGLVDGRSDPAHRAPQRPPRKLEALPALTVLARTQPRRPIQVLGIRSTSRAVTSAPRRSSSNAQNPSNVPTSRTRFPVRSVGIPYLSTNGRRSNMPGVTRPGASSCV